MERMNDRHTTSKALSDVLIIVACDCVGTASDVIFHVVNGRGFKISKVKLSIEIVTREALCGVVVGLKHQDLSCVIDLAWVNCEFDQCHNFSDSCFGLVALGS